MISSTQVPPQIVTWVSPRDLAPLPEGHFLFKLKRVRE